MEKKEICPLNALVGIIILSFPFIFESIYVVPLDLCIYFIAHLRDKMHFQFLHSITKCIMYIF